MPDALVVLIIIVAIVAILRGDARLPDVVKIGAAICVVSLVGLAVLYVPSRLYETLLDRDSPTWLTMTTAIIALLLAGATHLAFSLYRPTRPSQRNGSTPTADPPAHVDSQRLDRGDDA